MKEVALALVHDQVAGIALAFDAAVGEVHLLSYSTALPVHRLSGACDEAVAVVAVMGPMMEQASEAWTLGAVLAKIVATAAVGKCWGAVMATLSPVGDCLAAVGELALAIHHHGCSEEPLASETPTDAARTVHLVMQCEGEELRHRMT